MTPGRNLACLLEARAEAGGWSGEAAFLVGERVFTHADVHAGGARAASLLADLGVVAGDRVLLALPDGIQFAWAFLGAVRLGAVAVPMNPRLTAADHDEAVALAAPAVVVCDDDLATRFAGRQVLAAGGLEAALEGYRGHPGVEVSGGDPAYAQFTSGTTGAPKAAVHGHADPLVYFDAFARRAIDLDRGDVVLSVSKLYFAYGLGNAFFFPLLAGCRAVLHAEHPLADDVADLAARHAVTVLFAVPTFYARLLAAGRADAWSSLRVAVCAGETLTVPLARRASALLGAPVLDGLGSTEVGQTFASNTLGRWREATVGTALPPYEVEVREGGGHPVVAGDVGDLWVAGPTLPLGHLAAGAVVPRRGGWLCTGDRAVLDADGFVYLRGRADDMDQVGGITVSPVEIEAVLSRHPCVGEVAVAGVVGGDGASRLEAFVVPAPGSAAGTAVEDGLLALARAELAPFKVPRAVTFVDALPRTPTGKLRRFVLRGGGWPAAGDGQPAQRAENRSR